MNAPLADVVQLVAPVPQLQFPPTTRIIDEKGRVSVRLGGLLLGEVMGWKSGALSVKRDGLWVLLRFDPKSPLRRHDGRARLGNDGRLLFPAALQRLIGVFPGSEVALLVLQEHGVVAACHPSRLLLGAPRSGNATRPLRGR